MQMVEKSRILQRSHVLAVAQDQLQKHVWILPVIFKTNHTLDILMIYTSYKRMKTIFIYFVISEPRLGMTEWISCECAKKMRNVLICLPKLTSEASYQLKLMLNYNNTHWNRNSFDLNSPYWKTLIKWIIFIFLCDNKS